MTLLTDGGCRRHLSIPIGHNRHFPADLIDLENIGCIVHCSIVGLQWSRSPSFCVNASAIESVASVQAARFRRTFPADSRYVKVTQKKRPQTLQSGPHSTVDIFTGFLFLIDSVVMVLILLIRLWAYIFTQTHKYRRTWNGIQRSTCLNSLDETSQVLEVTWFPLSTSFSTWSNCALRPSYQPPGPILILTKIGQIIPRTGCIDTRWINWGSIHSHHCQLMKHDRSRFCQLLPAARAKLASRRWILAAGPTWKSTCKSTRRQIHCEFHCNKPNEWCGLWFRTFGFDPVI